MADAMLSTTSRRRRRTMASGSCKRTATSNRVVTAQRVNQSRLVAGGRLCKCPAAVQQAATPRAKTRTAKQHRYIGSTVLLAVRCCRLFSFIKRIAFLYRDWQVRLVPLVTSSPSIAAILNCCTLNRAAQFGSILLASSSPL